VCVRAVETRPLGGRESRWEDREERGGRGDRGGFKLKTALVEDWKGAVSLVAMAAGERKGVGKDREASTGGEGRREGKRAKGAEVWSCEKIKSADRKIGK
jgi:hypothetical protein